MGGWFCRPLGFRLRGSTVGAGTHEQEHCVVQQIDLENVPLETRFNEEAYPVWKTSFDPATRRQMIDEDLNTARHVVTLLLTIVIGGVLLGAVGVLLAI
jgi:hypothetical protein